MKQKLLKSMLLLCVLVFWGASNLWAAEDDTHDFPQTLQQLLNNNASITSINIAQQSYPVKKVRVHYRYNKSIENAVTMSVSIGSNNWGAKYSVGTASNYTYADFSGDAVTGAIVISFTNNTGNGTGHGTFYVDNIQLVEGAAAVAGTTAAPSITGDTPFLDNTTVTITNAASADGADIYYTLNGDEPTTTTSETCFAYSAPFEVSETTTVKAIAKKSSDANASSVVNKTFTKVTPMTVSDALTAISGLENNGTIAAQCVSGIVCTAGSLSSGAITYYISADGTETNRLQVYKGKGLNNADFESAGDIAVGDEVVIYGTLKNFNGNTPEFDQGSYLLSKVGKPAPTFSLDVTEKSLDAYTHETVDVTLTTNTDGAITCESSNEDVATVALKSGNVYTITAQTAGSATITIKSAVSENYAPASATVAITVTDNRADAEISFANASVTKTWGESFTGQALTNTNSVAVEWSSTDEAVATVDNTGAVTVLKAGTTTIKATFAGDATYKAAVASYTLTVNKANAGLSYTTTDFDIMLNDDTFEAPALNNPNGLIGITYSSNEENVALVDVNTGELVYNASVVGTAKIKASFAGNDCYYPGSASYTINIIDPTVKGTKYNPYTVAEVNSGNYSGVNYVKGYIVGFFNGKDSNASSSGNSNLALSDTPDEISGANTIAVQLPSGAIRTAWNIDDNNVIGMEVLIKGNITGYFTNKTGVKSPSEVTAISVPATLNASGYATFASTYPLDFSDDSEFSAWQITGVNGTAITFSQITGAVAAGTGVLLKGTASATISIPVAASGTDISSTNKLTGITTATAVNDNQYYGLSDNKFVKVNAGTVPAGKALLPVSAVGAGVKEFTFIFDDKETGIRTIEKVSAEEAAQIFDLSGRRLSKMQKGINIVNGKKILF